MATRFADVSHYRELSETGLVKAVFCPVCGQRIYNANVGIAEQPRCHHLLFMFFSRSAEFISASPRIQAEVDEAVGEANGLDRVVYLARKLRVSKPSLHLDTLVFDDMDDMVLVAVDAKA